MYRQLPHADLFGCHASFNSDKRKGMHMPWAFEGKKRHRGSYASPVRLITGLATEQARVLLCLLSSLFAFGTCGE